MIDVQDILQERSSDSSGLRPEWQSRRRPRPVARAPPVLPRAFFVELEWCNLP